MVAVLLFLILNFQEVPVKPSAEYTLKFDLSFKSEPSNPTKFETVPETGGLRNARQYTNLPYLELKLKALVLTNEETRIRVTRGEEVFINRKIKAGDEVGIQVGFIADIKDEMVPGNFTVHFLSNDRQAISQIQILFDADGSFYVNGEKRGQI